MREKVEVPIRSVDAPHCSEPTRDREAIPELQRDVQGAQRMTRLAAHYSSPHHRPPPVAGLAIM